MRKYIPKGGNGGKRPGAGQPRGGSKRAELEIRRAILSGKLGHMLLLEWAQTGVMRLPKMEVVLTRVPEPSDRKLKADDPDPPARFKQRRTERIVRDEAGKVVYEDVVIDPYLRIDCAKQAAPYYAARLTPQPVDKTTDPNAVVAQQRTELAFMNHEIAHDLPKELLSQLPKPEKMN